jgi:hypothetical protein
MFVYQRVPSGNQMWRDFVVSIGDLTSRHAGFRLAFLVVCTHRVPSSNPRMQWRIAIFDANIIYKRFFAVQGLFITRHEYHQRVPYQSGWFAWNILKWPKAVCFWALYLTTTWDFNVPWAKYPQRYHKEWGPKWDQPKLGWRYGRRDVFSILGL